MFKMSYILTRWIITAAAIWIAVLVVPGIDFNGSSAVVGIFLIAAILGFVNAIIRPILTFLSCGCVIATLGLFLFVINAFTLLLSSWIAQALSIDFVVDGFVPALLGSILISLVSFVLSLIFSEDKK